MIQRKKGENDSAEDGVASDSFNASKREKKPAVETAWNGGALVFVGESRVCPKYSFQPM
jgi:hypothetical protein